MIADYLKVNFNKFRSSGSASTAINRWKRSTASSMITQTANRDDPGCGGVMYGGLRGATCGSGRW